MAYPPFEEAARVVDQFLDILETRGLGLKHGGKAADEALAMTDVLEMWKRPDLRPDDPRQVVRAATGFVDLAGKVVSAANKPDFNQLWPHLVMLSKTTVLQNACSTVTDDAANKVIELYVACLVMSFGSNVALDHPTSSKGDNPDVMFDFRGQRWAIALKTLHSTKPRTIYDNIKKGADQIEASNAQFGLVMLNTKNVLGHDQLWPSPHLTFPEAVVLQALQAQIGAIIAPTTEIPADDWMAALGPARKAKPPVIYFGQTVSSAVPEHGEGQPMFMAVKAVAVDLVPAGDPAGAMKLVNALHHETQHFL